MTQTEPREDFVLHDWAVNHPETGNRILIQVTWTPRTGWSYSVWDRDTQLGGEVELFDYLIIIEQLAGLRTWTRQDEHGLRDMPKTWRRLHDPHAPMTKWLTNHT